MKNTLAVSNRKLHRVDPPAALFRAQSGTLLLHLSEWALALMVALKIRSTPLMAIHGALHLVLEPWHLRLRTLLMAHGVVMALLVAATDVHHLSAVLPQFHPSTCALLPAVLILLAFGCAGNESCLRMRSTQHAMVELILVLVLEVTVVEVTVVAVVVELTMVVGLTVVVVGAVVVEVTVVVVVVVELALVMVGAVVVEATAVVVVELTMVVGAVVVQATMMVEVTLVTMVLAKFVAHVQKLIHWDVASIVAIRIRTTFCIALDDALDLCCHFGAFWQWALFVAFHILSTILMALDDPKAFLALLLHVLSRNRVFVVHSKHNLGYLGLDFREEMVMMTMVSVVVVAKAHQTTKAKKAGEDCRQRTAQIHWARNFPK